MLHFSFRFFICNAFICLFAGMIIGFKKLLGKHLSARIQYNIWLLFLLLLAVPFLPAAFHFGQIGTWLNFPLEKHRLTNNADIQSSVSLASASTLDKMNDFAVSISTKTPSVVHTLLLLVWIIGMLTMLFLAFRSWRLLHALEKSALPLQNSKVREIYQECLSEMKIRRSIPIYSTAFLKSPITVGCIRPRIYMPIHLISDFNRQDIRFMLLHELQHYRRKDTVIGMFMNLIGILYWFNPLVWYALKEMRCEREIACDSAVLQMLCETDYEAYGNALINLAEKLSLSPFPFALGIGGSMEQMKRRILNIANFKKATLFQKLRGIAAYVLIAVFLLSCAPILSIYASEPDNYHFDDSNQHVTYIDLSKFFDHYDGSFVLYDANSCSWSIYNMDAAAERITPNSTYKIYDALLGLESGVITPEHSSMAWNGEDYPFDSWETDHDLKSAMHDSVNWYFQSIDSQVGFDSVKTFLRTIEYGNQTTGMNLDLYWTDFSLKISPIEQVELLKKFYNNEFQFQSQNINAVKDSICLSSSPDGSLYGKTGTGRVDGQDVNGWFIGYIEKNDNIYYFAANIQGTSNSTGSKAMEITTSVLSSLQLWNAKDASPAY